MFLTIVAILTPFLMDIIARSWKTDLMQEISGAIKTIDPSGISVIINIIIGFYIGSIILLFIDRYKRAQAVILSIGIFIIFVYMSINFGIVWNVLYIGLGILIGVFLGSSNSKKLGRKYEFERSAKSVSLASILYVSIIFIILYASESDSSGFIKDSIIILTFSYFFGEVMNYRAKGPKIFVLGPQQSGKTVFLAGCYMKVLNTTEIPPRASNDLIDLTEELHKGTWPSRTGDIRNYEFTFEVGKIFPKETTLRTIDYPGVYLENILDYMYMRTSILPSREKENKEKMDEKTRRYLTAAQEVTKADKLIFIIDGAKYPNFTEMGINYYVKIINKLHKNGKVIKPYIVITKSDLFTDEYPDFEKSYEGFKKFMEDKFSQNIFLRTLLVETAVNATFYPVFYYTRKVEDSHIPMRDENKNVYIFGFEEFMKGLIIEE